MGFVDFLKDVICAPYSIPIGLINNKKTLRMCSKTTKKELKLQETSSRSKSYQGRIGTQRADFSSFTEYEVLNAAIQNILRRNQNITQQTVIAAQNSNVNCDTVVSLEDDPRAIYDTKLRTITETKITENKEKKEVKLPAFGCCPNVNQEITMNVSTWENITEMDIQDIYNEVELNIENTVMEQGGGTVSGTDASVLSRMGIQNVLIQKIDEVIRNTTSQNVLISQALDYTDRYQRCVHYMDENGDWWYRHKTLNLSITIDVLSKNIIESTNKLIMNNESKIDSKTTVVINRITNYRVIVCSLLLNVVICYIIIKMFMKFLNKVN